MRVDLEEIIELEAKRLRINSVDIEDIEFYENGEKLEIPLDVIQKWRFIGLNNMDFITTDYYLSEMIIFKKKPSDIEG